MKLHRLKCISLFLSSLNNAEISQQGFHYWAYFMGLHVFISFKPETFARTPGLKPYKGDVIFNFGKSAYRNITILHTWSFVKR